ncbi:MAG TPA: DUF1304 domain-containing protein [Candidatus Lumbricidophila sp.]|nr:DUF1304 domain-containing protein [Candidatus Lumbricidophila sp.]
MITVIGSVLAAAAALLHVLIFLMESVWWRRERVWRRFGLRTQEQADTTRSLAYNQGFYNLFLAIGVVVGLVMRSAGPLGWNGGLALAGTTLTLFALASMVAAAIVLTTTGRGYVRAAAVQGTLPLTAIVLLVVASANSTIA